MFVGIFRATQFALQNIGRNVWLTVITIFLLVLTTFSITLVAGLNVVGSQMIHAIEEKVDIRFAFYTYVPEEQILDVQTRLKELEQVKQVRYISQQQALQDYRAAHKNDESILSALEVFDENVLPASIIVQAKDITKFSEIIDHVQRSDYRTLIDFEHSKLSDSQEIITTMNGFIDRMYTIGIGVSLLFVIISVIVIFNTIRITIYNHREEVGIMKLVGATNWFIRGPFILEGVILGTIAALLTLGIFYIVLLVTDQTVTNFFAGYNFSILRYFHRHILAILGIEILGAVLLSVGSSMIAITRHLKV